MNRHPSTRRPVARTAILLAGSALALLAPLSPASAGDDRVERSGSCSAGARWDLKVKSDDGRLEVEGEVDSNQSGQTWRWRFRHNGEVAAKGRKETAGPSGSFSVERRLVDLQGTDKIVFRARHDGETCRGVVNF
jgi:hypothetical protein